VRVLYSARALADLDRWFDFLEADDPSAAGRAAVHIREAVAMLENHPFVGRPIRGELRELVISHGRSGHVALHRVRAGTVVVLALRQQREAGYQ
jgi:plasmid stabilization system protein ParE